MPLYLRHSKAETRRMEPNLVVKAESRVCRDVCGEGMAVVVRPLHDYHDYNRGVRSGSIMIMIN